jgi:hypothetical protein
LIRLRMPKRPLPLCFTKVGIPKPSWLNSNSASCWNSLWSDPQGVSCWRQRLVAAQLKYGNMFRSGILFLGWCILVCGLVHNTKSYLSLDSVAPGLRTFPKLSAVFFLSLVSIQNIHVSSTLPATLKRLHRRGLIIMSQQSAGIGC